VEYSKNIADKHNLQFNLLSDKGNKIASQFGLVFSLPDDLRKVHSEFGIDLEKYNGDDSWTLPMPARFILDQQGTILSADVNPDHTVRPEPGDIIEILKDR
jgi:peroxiredoxin